MGNAFKKQVKPNLTVQTTLRIPTSTCDVADCVNELPQLSLNASVHPLIRYSLSFDMHVLHAEDHDVPTAKERRYAIDLIRDPLFWADYISASINHALNAMVPTPIFNLEVRLWRSRKNEIPGFYTGRVSWIAARTPHAELRAELEWAIEDRMTQYALSDTSLMWNIQILTIMQRGKVLTDTVLKPMFDQEDGLIGLDIM